MMWGYGSRGENRPIPDPEVFVPYVPCPRCGEMSQQKHLDDARLCWGEFLILFAPLDKDRA